MCLQAYRLSVAHIKHASVLPHLSPDHMDPAFVMTTQRKTAQCAVASSASIRQPRQQAVEAKRCQAMCLPKNSHAMNILKTQPVPASIQSQCRSHQTCFSVVTSFPRPHESSLCHDDRAQNHKLRRRELFNANSHSQNGQTMPHVLYLSSICKARLMF